MGCDIDGEKLLNLPGGIRELQIVVISRRQVREAGTARGIRQQRVDQRVVTASRLPVRSCIKQFHSCTRYAPFFRLSDTVRNQPRLVIE